MGRIQDAYETKFRVLLALIGARRVDQGLAWFRNKAETDGSRHPSTGRSWEEVYRRLFDQVNSRKRAHSLEFQLSPSQPPPRFICDAGLGGLARWLRAAGYESHWVQDITDEALIREATRLQAVLLTTDSMLMQRRVLRDRLIPSVWVSPSLNMQEQLRHILAELRLAIREPRCMSCGGELRRVSREKVAERIPPKTLRWLDVYFECQECGKLFWHGSHWEKIRHRLEESKV